MRKRFSVRGLGVLAVSFVFLIAVSGLAVSAELAKEQKVRLATGAADIGTVDPHFATKTGEHEIYRAIYEGLLRFPDGHMDPTNLQPALAEKWEVGSDNLTWTFHLRKGVKWHEGYGEVTSEDVKFTIERVLNKDVGSPWRKDIVGIVDSVEAVDRYTVKVKTKFPFAQLPALFVDYHIFVVCKKAVKELGDKMKYHPIGTGPFRFKEYKSREKFVMVRNDDYWRGRPIIEEFTLLFMPEDSTREMALNTGEVHGISLTEKQQSIDRMRQKGFDVALCRPANSYQFHLNVTKKPLDDIKVRKALFYAINRQDFVSFRGPDTTRLDYSPLPEGFIGHTDDVEQYSYNPEKAKKLLAEAGYPNGFSMSMVISQLYMYNQPAQIVQEQWKKIGVNLELKVVDHPVYHRMIRKDVNPMVVYGCFRYPLDGKIFMNQFWHSSAIVGRPGGVINFSHYGEAIPGVDKYLEAADNTMDQKVAIENWQKAQKQIARDYIVYPLFTGVYGMAKTKKLDMGFEQKSFWNWEIKHSSRLYK
jgi:peptide/nickel transport system substrate-binding protein